VAEQLLRDLIPSARLLGVGFGALLLVIGIALVQRAARTWAYQAREQRLRDRVRHIEARWFEARM
jgi:hypothetical protein